MSISSIKASKRDVIKSLFGIAALAGVAGVAACKSASADISTSRISSDILFIEKGISYFTSNAAIAALIPANVLTTFDTIEADINGVLSDLSKQGDVVAISTAQGYVSLVAKDVTLAIDTVLALEKNGVNFPTQVTTILTAVKTLIPALEAAVEVAITTMSVGVTAMTPEQARAVLAGC